MTAIDRLIWQCSDEKLGRIIAGMTKDSGVDVASAMLTIGKWKNEGWEHIPDSSKRSILRAIVNEVGDL